MSTLSPVTPSLQSAAQWQQTLTDALKTPIKTRPYTALITRTTPTAFVLLIDQSESMAGEVLFNGITCSKADAVAQVVNQILWEMLLRCQKGDDIRHYYDVALVGYGGQSETDANLLMQAPTGRRFLTPDELKAAAVRDEAIQQTKTIRGQTITTIIKRPVWVEPVANSLTPMKSALELAESLVQEWIVTYQGKDVYPPTVINITDGAASDAIADELLAVSNRIKALYTMDGNTLLFNVHLSDVSTEPLLFPSRAADLPADTFAQLLYDMSSSLPTSYNPDIAQLTGKDAAGAYTGFCFNADVNALVKFMNIGTPTNANQNFGLRQQPV
ncbi:hypothetical protein [Spirosoma sp.]|uniref:hypothetical protein n=1 Tax=Spirosoma sp. TaxID=1899569 RepID=UPI003B3A4A7D